MDKVTLLFSTRSGLTSRLIRLVTWSRWSHVAIVLDPARVIDSTYSHKGVRVRSLDEAVKTSSDYQFVELWVPNAAAVRMAALDEQGKPYDWTALLGLWFKRDWQEPDSWFCSELVAYAFERAACPLFRDGTVHRITPDHLWKLCPEMTKGWMK